MAVPDFQSLMLPLLRVASDGQEHSLAEARDALAREFQLSDPDLEEPLPSGRQSKFSNRVAWAKSYLQPAGYSCPRAEDTSRCPFAGATS
jgi:restriction endonuclease Mrr